MKYIYISKKPKWDRKWPDTFLEIFFAVERMVYRKLESASLNHTYHVSNLACCLKWCPTPVCRCCIMYHAAIFRNRPNLLLLPIQTSQLCGLFEDVSLSKDSQDSFLSWYKAPVMCKGNSNSPLYCGLISIFQFCLTLCYQVTIHIIL